MKKSGYRIGSIRLILIVCLILSSQIKVGLAADGDDEPARQASVTIPYTRYKWWLIRWADNQVLCTVYTGETGLPSGDAIYDACGKAVYDFWAATPACSTDALLCSGVYLHLVGSEKAEKEVLIDLPPPLVTVTLANCPDISAENICKTIPSLILTGDEPIEGETITAIRGFIDGKPFSCAGSICEVPLQPTPIQGVTMDFQAESSFGDTSEVFTARVRVVDSGVSLGPGQGGWYVDVISSQWRGNPVPTCAQIWDVFPPVGEAPNWLSTPVIPELLATETPYYYLAGRLIAQGAVDVSGCPGGGLLSNGYANECGIEKALPLVVSWQNQFDAQILATAKQVNIPAQTLKNLFAQESQFWPGAFKDPKEFGLGQLTDSGAETILLWDTRFFYEFCPTVLDASTCERGYVYLSKSNQQLIRGALAKQAQADCPNCPNGVNLLNVEQSIELFAHTLVANCAQVSRIVFNATDRAPASVTNYENLWKFTAANYHVGPGCLSYAMYATWARRDPITWENVSANLTPACQGVIDYVDSVTR